jgi:hypothetical protein
VAHDGDPVSTPAREPRLLTVAEYLALGETELGYDELVEGRVFMSPSPGPDHNRAVFRVAVRVEPQLPSELEVLLDLDVDLELAPPDAPGFTRRPDLVVARSPWSPATWEASWATSTEARSRGSSAPPSRSPCGSTSARAAQLDV